MIITSADSSFSAPYLTSESDCGIHSKQLSAGLSRRMPEATRSWRFQPSAVLPLAFLLAIGLGLTELSIVYLLRSIHCDSFKENHPEIIVIPELDVCRLPEVQRLYSRDLSIYFAISTVLSIILSGPYGKLSDKKGRRHAMLVAASITAVGDAWLCLSGKSCVYLRFFRK